MLENRVNQTSFSNARQARATNRGGGEKLRAMMPWIKAQGLGGQAPELIQSVMP